MNKIAGFVKKNRWFKLGKWKEPVFLQDIIIRSYLEKKKDIVLPYHSNMALTVGFKQFMRLAEYEELKQKVKQDLKQNQQEIFQRIKQEVHQAIKITDLFKPKQLNYRIIKKYVNLTKVLGRQSFRFIIMGYALEELYPEKLPRNFYLGKKQFTPQLLLAIAALPKGLMPMIAENISLLKMAIKLKQQKSIGKDLKNHTKKFNWMNSICWWDEPFDERYYFIEVKKLAAGNPRKQLDHIISSRKKQYQRATEVLKQVKRKYKSAWQYIDMIRSLADWREESWDAASRTGVRLRPLFKILAAKYYLSYNQLLMLSSKELLALAENKLKIDLEEINRRLISFGIFSTTATINKPVIFSGNEAEKLSILIEGKRQNLSEFFGLPIWPGITRGKVRVLQSADEIQKIEDGEILVCPMTDPDYMPGIRKAKAIITDQGGVLCHAAIIARELQKICLVGTQIATKVLRNGNLVEVDANKGIIRKL